MWSELKAGLVLIGKFLVVLTVVDLFAYCAGYGWQRGVNAADAREQRTFESESTPATPLSNVRRSLHQGNADG